MIRFKANTFLIHLTGWLLFLTFPFLFMSGRQEEQGAWSPLLSPYYWQFCLCYIAIFYLNARFLFPRFFLQRKYFQYAIIVLLLLTGIYFLQPFDHLLNHDRGQEPDFRSSSGPPSRVMIPPPIGSRPPPGDGPSFPGSSPDRPPLPDDSLSSAPGPHPAQRNRPNPMSPNIDVTSFFIFMIIMALSTATSTMQQWQVTERRAVQAEADKANAELSFLKAQINPHFLFNTLNNIYSLAVTKNENTAASIMKLSNIMRYVTDEVTEDFVSLSSEVACIQDYIDLQRLRLSKNVHVEVEVSGNLEPKIIAPLILMTFVENVFKHGISNHQPAPITIKLYSDAQTISFFCQNKIFTTLRQTERTGVGLSNTRQRLAHLYPNRHLLNITQDNHLFTVQLTLQA